MLEGLKRKKGMAAVRKAPALTSQIRDIVKELPKTLAGLRDRALLLLGFAGRSGEASWWRSTWRTWRSATKGLS